MFSSDDTIAAIATPAGLGGIGVVRISGPDAVRIAQALAGREAHFRPRYATLSRISASGAADEAVITWFPSPRSYTGEDVVEVSAHGSPVLLNGIVRAAVAAGARLAEPGEFTFRAFLRGRIDLVQAEAVRDLIESVTPLQARAAFDQLEGTLTGEIREIDAALFELTARLEASLDFPDEGYHFIDPDGAASGIRRIGGMLDDLLASSAHGRLVRDGLQVVIAGRPNAGKSSLFNRLAGAGRAIVTEAPGTTRDLLTETVDIAGIPVTLVDTAGLNSEAVDPIEIEGMTRALAARDVASVVMIVLDRSRPLTDDDRRLLGETRGKARVIVANKCDRNPAWELSALAGVGALEASAATGEGLDTLRCALARALTEREPARDVPAVTNTRHVALLDTARHALGRAAAAAEAGTPEEFVLADLHEARAALEEVTGRRTPDDVLREIFARFCIGK